MTTPRYLPAVVLLVLAAALAGVPAEPARAAVSVTKAEFGDSRLRIEGQAAPNRAVLVDGVQMTTSGSTGAFRIERSGYTPPPNCTVGVDDGDGPTSARLSGCTVTTAPPATAAALASVGVSPSSVVGGTGATATVVLTAAAPSGGAVVALADDSPAVTLPAGVTVPAGSTSASAPVSTTAVTASTTATVSAAYAGVTRTAALSVTPAAQLRITTTSPLPNARVGADYAGYIEACCGQGTPYRWSLVSGTVPDGLRFAGDSLRLSRTTAVTGVATRVQTTTFTVRVRDGAGATATRTFSLTVDPAAPLVITNQGDQLAPGTVGMAYETGVFAGGGVQPYRWSLVAGTLPPGLSLQTSPGRITGTPTTAGSYLFTLRVDDSGGQSATRQFGITVGP